MTKQQTIEQAYGSVWPKVKTYIRDYDGSVPTFPRLMDDDDCTFFWKELGYKYSDLEQIDGDCEPSRWRPLSLSGIENNNGWTKIQTEYDLPKEDGVYSVMDSGCYFEFVDFDAKNRLWFRHEFKYNPTHWRAIETIPSPLY